MKSSLLVRFPLRIAMCIVHPVFFIPFATGVLLGYLRPELIVDASIVQADSRRGLSASEQARLDRENEYRKERDKEKKKLPKEGVLSQSFSAAGGGSQNAEVPWGSDLLGDKGPPVSGSVSRIGNREWSMKVLNTSDDTYSVSLEVVQMRRGAQKLKSDYYSYTLKPKQAVEKTFKAAQGAEECTLKLNKWKKIGSKKKEEQKQGVGTPSAIVAPDATASTEPTASAQVSN
jgi:hypothetical protein